MRGVGGTVLGDVRCDGAECGVPFTLEEDCAQGTASCCHAGRANQRSGRNAECGLGIRIESHRLGGEAEFGGEGGERGVGAGGGDEGGEGFEGAHAANVAGEVAGSGCEIARGGAKDCGVCGAPGDGGALARGRTIPKLGVRKRGALGAECCVSRRRWRCES